MSIEQLDKIDFVGFDGVSGDVWLTISDHLPWAENEGFHLSLLQEKLNAYLRFVESGELRGTIPKAAGRNIVINLVGKYPMSRGAEVFLKRASAAIEGAGFRLQFSILPSGK